MRAGPKARRHACLGDEILDRPETGAEQRAFAVVVGREGAGKRRGDIQMVPDAVIRHVGMGRKKTLQLAQLAGVDIGGQLWAEAPQGHA